MTDIPTKLAALTQKGENGLLPCPMCGDAGQPLVWRKGNEHTKDRGCDVGCAECGFTKSIRVIRYSLEWAEERAVAAWNSRPHEAALIALVQEAASEIERLRGYLRQTRRATSHMEMMAITDEAFGIYPPTLNPQEDANGQD